MCIKDLYKLNYGFNLAEFSLYSQFFSPLFSSVSWLLIAVVPRSCLLLMPPFYRVMADPHGSPTTESWVNVGRHVLPSGLGHGETVVSSWDRVLFLWVMSIWSVLVSSWRMPVHDVLPILCSCYSAGEIRLRVRDEDMAELVLFITQHIFLSYKT